MKHFFSILLSFLLSGQCASAQQTFSVNTNTNKDDLPRNAVELPHCRYAFIVAQNHDYLANNPVVNGLLIVADSLGNTIRSKSLPADSFHMFDPTGIIYHNNKIYLTALLGNDTFSHNFPESATVLVFDTSLNLIDKGVFTSTSEYQWMNDCRLISWKDKLLLMTSESRKYYQPATFRHPSLRLLDSNLNVLQVLEIDSNTIPSTKGGDDYDILINNIETTDATNLLLFTNASRVNNNTLFIRKVLLEIDSSLNPSKTVNLGCIEKTCFYAFDPYSARMIFSGNRSFFTAHYTDSGHCIAKFFLPDSSTQLGAGDHTAQKFMIVNDTVGRKWFTLQNLSIDGSSIYYLGNTNFDTYTLFSTNKNKLTIIKVDTALQLHWTKQVGGDAHYFPVTILATSDGGCLITSFRYDGNNPGARFDHYIFKLDGNGNFLNVQELDAKSNKAVKLFPNPAKDVLNIELIESGNYTLQILDMSGKVLQQTSLTEQRTTVNIAELPQGMYGYKLTDHAGKSTTGLWLKK